MSEDTIPERAAVAGLEPRALPAPGGERVRTALAVAGFGILAASAGVEVLRIGSPGLGPPQLALAMAGFGLLLARDWLQAPGAERTADLARYLTIAAELAVLTLVFTAWQLEGPGLYEKLAPIVFVGFLVHHALPAEWRPTGFLLLSLIAAGVILGPAPAVVLVAVGAVLIGLCHLPVRFGVRVALVAGAGGLLALARAGLLPWELPAVVWPVLASMFMFRLVVYLYDLRHGNAPPRLSQRLSYFFMLPNPLFPLFPVVDASTYHRRYYDAAPFAVYQRGVEWMLRGTLHLIAYRVIYQRLTISPTEVADTGTLVQYLVTTFGLYLRVSGQFHLIAGMLHLFGHRLPETHRLYFLASSFTDLWRRINIYWKDFIQKIFFYPVYFRVRKHGETAGLVVATVLAFVATWALHSYQWFWFLGRPLLTGPDMLFWAMLAGLVLVNSLIERKHGRMRKLDERSFSAGQMVSLGLRSAGTFLLMCVLWAMWNSASLAEWASLFRAVEWGSGRTYVLLGAIAGLAAAAAVVGRYLAAAGLRLGGSEAPHGFARRAGFAGAGMVLVLLAVQPAVTSRFPLEQQVVLRDLRQGDLSPRDAELLKRGYYENLMAVSQLNSRLWEVYTQRPKDWQFIAQTPAGRLTNDFLDKELVPGAAIVWHGAAFRVNRWGMRDRDYERTRPSAVRRIVVLGASYVVGSGVGDGKNFESLLEDRLNGDAPAGGPRYEFLNFAVPGYTVVQQLALLDRKVLDFEPDAMWFVAHPDESLDIVNHLVKMVRAGVAMPYPELDEVLRRAEVTPDLSEAEATRRLQPFHQELLAWVYRQMVARCRERGIRPVWIYLPATRTVQPEAMRETVLPAAREAGFALVDLSDIYDGFRYEDITIAVYDSHPNEQGHQNIADRLYRQVRARPELVTGLDERRP